MSFLDFLFPKYCVNCKLFGSYLCANCFAQLSFDTQVICLVCGKGSLDGRTHPLCKKTNSIDGVFCGVSYAYVVKKLVYVFKYQPYVSDIQQVLVDLLYESLIQKELFIKHFTSDAVFIPVPLFTKKLQQRGYNQSFLLAKGLAKKFEVSVADILLRTKETKPQFGLSKQDRKENMKNAFAIKNKCGTFGKTAFLIDDILTTGATLVESAKIVKQHGFQNVWGITFARD